MRKNRKEKRGKKKANEREKTKGNFIKIRDKGYLTGLNSNWEGEGPWGKVGCVLCVGVKALFVLG